MRTTTIIKQQGSLCFNLLYYFASTSALIASIVRYHYCSSEIVSGSKSSVSLVSTIHTGWPGSGDSGCGFLAQSQVHPVTHSLIGGRDYGGHQENKRRSSGHSPPQ